MASEKLVILIGGTAGVGKTWAARYISQACSLDHRLGTGFLREVLKTAVSEEAAPSLHRYTFSPPEGMPLLQHYELQCRQVKEAVEACIRRARAEGTSLVVEGSNLLPSVVEPKLADLYVVIKIEDESLHRHCVLAHSHSLRKVSEGEFQAIRKIQEYILRDCQTVTDGRLLVLERDNSDAVGRQIAERVNALAPSGGDNA